jgi:AraC-like DNA-binding protein
LAYLRDANLPEVTLSELAVVAYVRPRTLEYGFQSLFDLTPFAFFHLLRLHAVRPELVASEDTAGTVREMADQWDFLRHRRFSGYYREGVR